MKHLKKFENFDNNISIYDKKWENLLPKELKVIKGYDNQVLYLVYEKGNVMLNADMIQITYEISNQQFGIPDTLEIDLYFVRNSDSQKIDLTIDITFGDEVVCEFKITPPNKVDVIQQTSYHSKFDPSNTVFAFEDDSLTEFVNFLNRFNYGIKLTEYDLRFLDKKDNYR